jgi:Xaa-Pro dipeptidase
MLSKSYICDAPNVLKQGAFYDMNVDWEPRVDFDRMRKQRTERARNKMHEHGLSALLCFEQDKIRYISGTFAGVWRKEIKFTRYSLLAGDSEPINFETVGVDAACVKRAAPWVDVRPAYNWTLIPSAYETISKKFADGVKEALEEHGVLKERVGVDLIDSYGYNALKNEGINVVDGMQALNDAVSVKFPDELDLLRQACNIADAGFQTAYETIKPGVRECEVYGAIVNTLFSLGAESVPYLGCFASGPRTNPIVRFGPTDRIIRSGDIVAIDVTPRYVGYKTCIYRNFVCGGKATSEQKDLHKQAYELLYDAIDKIRPGASTIDIAESWRGADAGDLEYESISAVQFAHGTGLGPWEPPIISLATARQYPETIKENMCIAVETYASGERESARLEDMVIVTPTGTEIISKTPYAEALVE